MADCVRHPLQVLFAVLNSIFIAHFKALTLSPAKLAAVPSDDLLSS